MSSTFGAARASPATAPSPHRRRARRRIAVLLAGLALAAAVWAAGAAACRPAWFQPVALDYSRLEADQLALNRIENQVSAALNQREPAVIELTDEQVNRWLAARRELWISDPLPELERIERPFVSFLGADVLRVAALVRAGDFALVASADLGVSVRDETLRLECRRARLGALPIPTALLRRALDALAHGLPGTVSAAPAAAWEAPSGFVWPNGKRPARIRALSVRQGVLRIEISPR